MQFDRRHNIISGNRSGGSKYLVTELQTEKRISECAKE